MSQTDLIILIANILAGIGMFLFSISGIFKSKKRILVTQTVYHLGFAVPADIMLKGYVGLFQELMSGIRNLFVIFNKNNRIINIIIIIVAVLLSSFGMYVEAYGFDLGFIHINKMFTDSTGYTDYLARGGWMGFLPIIANLQYSIVVLKCKNPIIMRISLLISCSSWAIYCFFIRSFISAGFNLLSFVINFVQLIIYLRVTKKSNTKEEVKVEENITLKE